MSEEAHAAKRLNVDVPEDAPALKAPRTDALYLVSSVEECDGHLGGIHFTGTAEEVDAFVTGVAFTLPFLACIEGLDGMTLAAGQHCTLSEEHFERKPMGDRCFERIDLSRGLNPHSVMSSEYDIDQSFPRLPTHLTEEEWDAKFPGMRTLTTPVDLKAEYKYATIKEVCRLGGVPWPWEE